MEQLISEHSLPDRDPSKRLKTTEEEDEKLNPAILQIPTALQYERSFLHKTSITHIEISP